MSALNNYFIDTLKYKYADFEGRARRSEYWYFNLFNFLIQIALYFLIFGFFSIIPLMSESLIVVGFGLIILYGLAVFIPGLALTVRRLHDTNKSGWLLLIAIVPLIGPLALLIFFLMEGTHGPNNYGPDPKALAGDDVTDHLIV